MSKARDIADLDFNSPDIDGGNIDGATIGATTAAVGSFTGVNISGGSQLGQDFAYFKSNSTTNASLTLRKDSTGADAIDFLQLRSNGNGLIGKIEGDGDINFKDGNFTGSITATSATFTDDVAINNGSPELYFGTTGNHYNWRLAAQEALDSAFEISVGSQDTNYADDTYNPILVIDNSGTLAVGTTDLPAWNTSVFDGRIRIGARGALVTTTASTQLTHNTYYNGSYKYIGNDFATRYYSNDGNHVWLTAPSGSADATISFSSPRMVISNGGFVGIRESAPFAPLHIKETGWSSGAPYGTVQLIEGQAVNDNNWSHLVITDADDSDGNGGSISFATGAASALNPFSSIKGYRQGSNYGALDFYTRPSGGTSARRMRISSDGSIGVGIDAPGNNIHILGNSTTPSAGITIQTHDTANAKASVTLMSRDVSNVNKNVVYENSTGTAVTLVPAGGESIFSVDQTARQKFSALGVNKILMPYFSGGEQASYSASHSGASTGNSSYYSGDKQYKIIGQVNGRANTKSICIKTNLTAGNIMFWVHAWGYHYGYGIGEAYAGGYTYYSGGNVVISKAAIKPAHSNNMAFTDSYRLADGSLCFRLNYGHTGYTEGRTNIGFHTHGNIYESVEIVAVQIQNDETNFQFGQ